uniref:Ig-like domain-containing protein n=1 Tax=Latimeria chalumnae TaxID=7897 RepID=H2ZTE7_LATCH
HNKSEPSVEILTPSCDEIREKRKATLVCVIQDFFPEHIEATWKREGRDLQEGFRTQTPVKQPDGQYATASRLRISARQWFSGQQYTCAVFHKTTEAIREKSLTGPGTT